jgi:uncharacterized protein YdiU (UPF0061 family)
MNTDNILSGETIIWPCAFMDTYDPATVFGSIDEGAIRLREPAADRAVEPARLAKDVAAV